MELPTYSALQTVKYRLGMEKEDELRQESAIKLLAASCTEPCLRSSSEEAHEEYEAGLQHIQQGDAEHERIIEDLGLV